MGRRDQHMGVSMATYNGTDASESILGSAENDVLIGGSGADTLNGGDGFDYAAYWSSPFAVGVRLFAEAADDDGFGATDLLLNIEGVFGSAQDDAIYGNGLANVLNGLDGRDSIFGLGGNDQLQGGGGDDRIDGGNGTDTVTLTGTRTDYAISLSAGQYLFVDRRAGNPDGQDTVIGAEFVIFDDSTVSFADLLGLPGATAGGDSLVGGAKADYAGGLGGADTLNGRGGSDTLEGGAGNDRLLGGIGDDSLDGSAGRDTLLGGAGDDRYRVDSTGDRVVETAGAGADTVFSFVSHGLAANVEALFLEVGAAAALNGRGNALANFIVGNEFANRLVGGGGDDTLDAWHGDDTLIGGAGDDTYVLGAGGAIDRVVEAANGGTDTALALASLRLAANVENLLLDAKAGDSDGTGNGLGNVMQGNAGANRLAGAGGDDTLEGGAGTDRLIGGAGADVFLMRPGMQREVITDFAAGEDRIDLSHTAIHDFAALQAKVSATATGGFTIHLGGGDVATVAKVDFATLSASDFVF